jgi:hypothetical protein
MGTHLRRGEILSHLDFTKSRPHLPAAERIRAQIFRAGTTPPFWFGSTISAKQANYLAVSTYNNAPNFDIHMSGPALVDGLAVHPFGLYQVHGSARKWTEDCYNKRFTQDSPVDGSPWLKGNAPNAWGAAVTGWTRREIYAHAPAMAPMKAPATAFASSGR